jgi:hypothetical protein
MTDTDDKTPKPPNGLRAAGRKWFVALMDTYDMSASPELITLAEEAAKTLDICTVLQRQVDAAVRAGETRTKGSRGQWIQIPEMDSLRAFRTQFAALTRQLQLPGEEDVEAFPRPRRDGQQGPMSRSESAKVAAAARWGKRHGTITVNK